jgi:hypothetical protein
MAQRSLVDVFRSIEQRIADSRLSGQVGHTGHIATVEYVSVPSKMRKGTKNNRNPFHGRVESKMRLQIRSKQYHQAEGVDEERSQRIRENTEAVTQLFIRRYVSTGTEVLSIAPEAILDRTFLVDGREATPEEVAEIKTWISESKPAEWLTLATSKIQRVAMEGEEWIRE